MFQRGYPLLSSNPAPGRRHRLRAVWDKTTAQLVEGFKLEPEAAALRSAQEAAEVARMAVGGDPQAAGAVRVERRPGPGPVTSGFRLRWPEAARVEAPRASSAHAHAALKDPPSPSPPPPPQRRWRRVAPPCSTAPPPSRPSGRPAASRWLGWRRMRRAGRLQSPAARAAAALGRTATTQTAPTARCWPAPLPSASARTWRRPLLRHACGGTAQAVQS